MRLCRLLIVLLAVTSLAACARQPPKKTAAAPVVYSELDTLMYGKPAQPSRTVTRVAQVVPVRNVIPVDDGPYTLDSGDKLRIVVFGQEALSNTYQVDANGQVSLPLIGAVPARGLTTNALAGAIAARLRQSFIRDPSVAVEIETYRPFFILGEVTYPGQYPYVAHMTVENAVAIAGGFTPRAKKGPVTITRKIQGVPAKFALPLNYPLRPGDTITVGERWF
jgi:polysaccharide export outer membrane protein